MFLRYAMRVLFVGTLLIISSSVRAQTGLDTSAAQGERYSKSAALQWSLFGTLAPVTVGYAVASQGSARKGAFLSAVLVGGGVTVGPSLGHLYADRKTYGWVMAGMRAAAVGSFLGLALDACPGLEECSSKGKKAMTAYLLVGAGILSGLVIGDIIAAPSSAEKANQRSATLSIAPRLFPDKSIGISSRLIL